LRAWAAADPAREGYAADLAALHRAYRAGLEAVGRPDEATRAVAAVDVLRREPVRWGGTPVFVYGFDDLTRIQLDTIEALALQVGAPVTVSLPYEPGREAFAGRATTYQELVALGAEREELPAVAAHYAAPALHHLERTLFEAEPGARPDPGDAVVLLAGGGERAELELVGIHVAGLLRDGVPAGRSPSCCAARGPRRAARAGPRRVRDPLRARAPGAGRPHRAGRGLLALLSCALLDGSPDDLLTWLRTPGLLRRPELADDLEVEVRRTGARTVEEARALWRHFPLEAIDRVQRAHRDGPAGAVRAAGPGDRRAARGPWKQTGAILDAEEATDARVARELRTALAELGALAARDPALVPRPPSCTGCSGRSRSASARARARTPSRSPTRSRSARGASGSWWPAGCRRAPSRARDARAVPRGRRAPGDQQGLGLRLALHEDRLGAERHLFYAAASRPTDQLVLAWHTADDDGRPQARSPFVDDVLDVLAPELAERTRVRELGAAGTDDPAGAPTAREAARAAAAGRGGRRGRGHRPARRSRGPRPSSPGARPGRPAPWRRGWPVPCAGSSSATCARRSSCPDPEPLVRGELAHAVLESVLGERAAAQDRPLPLREADVPASAAPPGRRSPRRPTTSGSPWTPAPAAALHRLEADLIGYLEWACRSGSAYAPAHFEVRFGGPDDPLPAVDVGGGLALQGRIDRVDVAGDGTALVYDYKGKTASPQAKWLTEGRLQLALYLRALPHLLGLQAAGGLYQPLGTDEDRRPRGALVDGLDPDLRAVDSDRIAPEELEALLDGALAQALAAAAELRAGRLEPRPATCGWRDGGCTHPSICRGGGL
jgi:RecB family exonuclease